MATIGTFSKTADGSYAGSIKTLSLNVKAAQFRPNEKADDKAPDFRIFAGQTEFGAAWKKTSRDNREYLSVKLDDPSFVAPDLRLPRGRRRRLQPHLGPQPQRGLSRRAPPASPAGRRLGQRC